jgi:hypothetical protein
MRGGKCFPSTVKVEGPETVGKSELREKRERRLPQSQHQSRLLTPGSRLVPTLSTPGRAAAVGSSLSEADWVTRRSRPLVPSLPLMRR